MGGVVTKAISPVVRVVDKVAGTNISGTNKPGPSASAGETPSAVAKATRSEEEMGARLRGARRRGRQLLSDARLSPEAGVQTLGGGADLGK